VRILDAASAGPQQPVGSTPDRRPGSVRRTTAIDTTRPEGLSGPLVVHGVGRDLLTSTDGTARGTGDAEVRLHLDPGHRVLELVTQPELDTASQLVGAVVGPGFRSKATAVAPDEAACGTVLNLLLDDLPGAVLVSGFVLLAADVIHSRADPGDEYLDARNDLCAGWAVEGTMMTIIREEGQNPMTVGPVAPTMLREDDPVAWHGLPPLPRHSSRRIRRLDVVAPDTPDAPATVDVFFRDSHFDDADVERVIHEYRVSATVDPRTRTVVDIAATADVLPWKECPGAVASATRLAGQPLDGLRRMVRKSFVGTSTCTHLNDVLRGLADVDALLRAVGS
jgi:hypothetical protein